MVGQIVIGAVMIALLVTIHAFALDFIIRNVRWLEDTALRKLTNLWKALTLSIVVLGVCAAHILEIWIWALFYLVVAAVPDLETALYFSTSSFTTLGFGDIVLTREWRLLGSIEGMIGFLLFGWSSAFIYSVVARIYREEGRTIKG